MSGKLLLKAMVLGTMAFSISTIGMAAEVQEANGLDSAQQTIASDIVRKEAVRSSWMDRTDVVVGVGVKHSEGSSSHQYHNFMPWENHPIVGSSDKSKSTELNKLYIETLQPVTHYDENAKSVIFVQGRIGRSGEKISSNKLNNYWVPARPAGTFTVHNGQTDKEESLGMNANIGIGYRRLSKGEHAYVGVNAFYDHAFKNGYKRVSGGVEYVVGLNEFHANIYKNLGANERKYTGLYGRTSTWYDPTGLYPYGRDDDTSLYNYAKVDYENHWILSENTVARGYDIGYARTFKNARWARVYADYYNWRGREAVRVGYYKLRLCHNKQLINSHFYRGVSELPYKLLFAVIYTHLEFRYEVSHTITSHHVHHFHQTRIPDGTLLDYMVQYRKPLFPQFFLYPKKFLPENNPHHKEFHLRPYIQNNANQ